MPNIEFGGGQKKNSDDEVAVAVNKLLFRDVVQSTLTIRWQGFVCNGTKQKLYKGQTGMALDYNIAMTATAVMTVASLLVSRRLACWMVVWRAAMHWGSLCYHVFIPSDPVLGLLDSNHHRHPVKLKWALQIKNH